MTFRLILLIAFLIASGCLFETRAPQQPTDEQPPWVPPSDSPLTVLDNMQTVISEHASRFDYMRSFSADFVMIPSEYDQSTFEETYAEDWSYTQEERFSSNFFNALGSHAVTMDMARTSTEDVINDIEERAILYRQYRLEIPRAITGFNSDTIEGLARLEMFIGNQGYWVIYRWEDAKISEDMPDWGELRHQFK